MVLHALIVAAALRRHKGGAQFAGREQVRSVATVLLPAVAMVVLTHVIGLYVSGALYLAEEYGPTIDDYVTAFHSL